STVAPPEACHGSSGSSSWTSRPRTWAVAGSLTSTSTMRSPGGEPGPPRPRSLSLVLSFAPAGPATSTSAVPRRTPLPSQAGQAPVVAPTLKGPAGAAVAASSAALPLPPHTAHTLGPGTRTRLVPPLTASPRVRSRVTSRVSPGSRPLPRSIPATTPKSASNTAFPVAPEAITRDQSTGTSASRNISRHWSGVYVGVVNPPD